MTIMTAAELCEMLDRLPSACDNFTVRFTTHDRSDWVEPEGWRCEGISTLILLSDADDEGADEIGEMSVDDLKHLLEGGNNKWCTDGNEVHNSIAVFIRDGNDYYSYVYYPTFKRFWINWKQHRVDIWMELL